MFCKTEPAFHNHFASVAERMTYSAGLACLFACERSLFKQLSLLLVYRHTLHESIMANPIMAFCVQAACFSKTTCKDFKKGTPPTAHVK
jgi:hypothetical protein